MELFGTKLQPSYFSILIQHKGAGLTDQLYQFNSFYKLGISLGLKYVYYPLKCERTSHNYDIYRFLGLDQYLSRFSESKQVVYKDIKFDGQDILRSKVKSLSDLKKYTVRQIDQVNIESGDIASGSDSEDRALVYRFSLIMGRGRDFFDLIQLAMPYWPVDFDPLSAYKSEREVRSNPPVYSNNRINVLVHMRQGDTALLHTPWNTFIPLFRLKERAANEYQSPREAGPEYIYTRDYSFFVSRLIAYFGRGLLSVVFSSDGFERAFSKLLMHRNVERFKLSNQQIKKLEEARTTYDEAEFRQLDKIKGCVSLIGESEQNMYGLIHSILEADILIVGTQQRMIPKFLSSYYELRYPKTIITLYKGQCPPDYLHLGLTSEKAKCMFFNVEEDNFADFGRQLRASLKIRRIRAE